MCIQLLVPVRRAPVFTPIEHSESAFEIYQRILQDALKSRQLHRVSLQLAYNLQESSIQLTQLLQPLHFLRIFIVQKRPIRKQPITSSPLTNTAIIHRPIFFSLGTSNRAQLDSSSRNKHISP